MSDHLALGTCVRYTRRASTCCDGFMRDMPKGFQRPEWWIPPKDVGSLKGQRTVETWPEEGEGTITGLVRRRTGRIHAGGVSGSGWGEPEYDAPYLEVKGTVLLYQVKSRLDQAVPVLVPLDAVEATA